MTNQAIRARHCAMRAFAAAGLIAGLTLILAGCALFKSHSQILIPQQKNAGQQLRYADQLRESANLRLIFDNKEKYKTARDAVREGYASVAKYFPADRDATALAKLNVIEMDAGLDDPNAPYSGTESHRISSSVDESAINQLEQLAKDYPEHKFIPAKAFYDQAMIYKRAGNYDDATKLFKHLADTYAKDQNPTLKNIGQRAARYYQQIYVVGK